MSTFTESPSLPPLSPDRRPCEEPPTAAAPPKTSQVLLMGLFLSALAFLLGSFPVRNSDLWTHLAAGREVAGGHLQAFSRTWLYDLGCYLCFSALGGTGLVGVKALVVAAVALVLLRLASLRQGGWLAVLCTTLAVLALSTRVLLQPATVSYLFLAATLCCSPGATAPRRVSRGRCWCCSWSGPIRIPGSSSAWRLLPWTTWADSSTAPVKMTR
jgi:hypothetical protein